MVAEILQILQISWIQVGHFGRLRSSFHAFGFTLYAIDLDPIYLLYRHVIVDLFVQEILEHFRIDVIVLEANNGRLGWPVESLLVSIIVFSQFDIAEDSVLFDGSLESTNVDHFLENWPNQEG